MLKYLTVFLAYVVFFNVFAQIQETTSSIGVDSTPGEIKSYRYQLEKAKDKTPIQGVYKIEEISGLSESDCTTQGFKMYSGTITASYQGCYKYSF